MKKEAGKWRTVNRKLKGKSLKRKSKPKEKESSMESKKHHSEGEDAKKDEPIPQQDLAVDHLQTTRGVEVRPHLKNASNEEWPNETRPLCACGKPIALGQTYVCKDHIRGT
jgi:hypothetical protein